MTSSTVAEQETVAAVHPALDAPGRAALREAVLAELARARPRPVAQRTLELLVQASLEPAEAAPGYRVIDRHGAARTRVPPGEPGPEPAPAPEPFTLAERVAELRERHPDLFLPPEPVPEPAPAPAEARESALMAGASEMRAATARFVEVQSERARSLAERSSVQGRAFALSAAGTLAGLRASLRAGRPRSVEAGAGTAAPADWDALPGRFRGAVTERLHGLRDRFGGPADEATRHQRLWFAGASAAVVAMVIAAGLVVTSRPPGETGGAAPAGDAPARTARAPAPPDTVTPPPEGDGRAEPEADAPPPAANAVTGPVQVIDTATLRVGGKLVRLFGVQWVRGGQAEELSRYIAGRSVTCQPAPGSESMNCLVEGRDLSEVVLFNGGGRASPEASPELVAAEDHARSERLGVWKR